MLSNKAFHLHRHLSFSGLKRLPNSNFEICKRFLKRFICKISDTADSESDAVFNHSARRALGTACDKASIADLHARNLYESQIVATIPDFWNGSRILEYPFRETDAETFTPEFYEEVFLESLAPSGKVLKRLPSRMKVHKHGDEFECDLYIRPPEGGEPISVAQLLQLSTEDVFPINGHDPAQVFINGKWAFIEITESPSHLPQKFYQLERAMHFLPRAASDVEKKDVGAVIILLNGKREDAVMAMSFVKLKKELLISSVPVFVGWVPFRNLFVNIHGLKGKVTQLTGQIQEMDTRLGGLGGQIQEMDTRLGGQIQQLTSSVNRLMWVGGFVCACFLGVIVNDKVGTPSP